MRQRVVRVSPHQAGKVFGVMYFLFGLLAIPVFVLPEIFRRGSSPFGLWFGLLLPVFYGVMGSLFVALAAWLDNVVAGWVGGLEITLEEERGEGASAE